MADSIYGGAWNHFYDISSTKKRRLGQNQCPPQHCPVLDTFPSLSRSQSKSCDTDRKPFLRSHFLLRQSMKRKYTKHQEKWFWLLCRHLYCMFASPLCCVNYRCPCRNYMSLPLCCWKYQSSCEYYVSLSPYPVNH